MKIKFDLISDIHIDSWIKKVSNKKIQNFIGKLLPPEPSETLIVAGDIGHYNSDITSLIKNLKTYYKNILFVFGNHDNYVFLSNIKKYKDSNTRKQLLLDSLKNIENVFLLDGNIVELSGVKYGGCTGWYEGAYGETVMNMTKQQINKAHEHFTDNKYVIDTEFHQDFRIFCERDKIKLNSIVDECNVIVTHHIPHWEKIPSEYLTYKSNNFFYFDGYELINHCKNKIWVYGHTHQQQFYEYNGCTFLCNPFGYEGEHFYYEKNMKIFPRTIRTYEQEL